MFKRYESGQWGLFIPMGVKKGMTVWNPEDDAPTTKEMRKHFCITVRFATLISALPFYEFRVRIGYHYL